MPSSNQRIAIELDAAIVDQLDQWTSDRTQAIEEAIQLWCKQQAADCMGQASDLRRQIQDSDETGWLV